ncbi:MAG: VWA domain-containing protein [Verrucomicrobiae bacterium]|nr:VWA domain-containing protein [Verrucomicrobiae bacterium]
MKKSFFLPAILTIAACGVFSPFAWSGSPPAEEPVKLTVRADRPLLNHADGPQEVIVRIDVEGCHPAPRAERNPLNLSIVLDRSGSMRGAKLEQARQAAEMLVERLGPDDIFSLVIYDTEVEVLVPPQRVGRNTDHIRREIRRIEAGGSTALYAGVETGGRQLAEFFDDERINRVILLSDGIANVGPSSNREIAQLGQSLARQGRSVTTVGLGDDYNEDLMTALAEASDANYYYVADVEALPGVFENELGELQSVIARRLELEITFPDGVEPLEILGRPETIEHRRGKIRFGTLAAEQSREIYVACRVDPGFAKDDAKPVVQARLAYADAENREMKTEREASVKSVDDAGLAAKSQVADITARAEIYRNAAATERTLALADAGNGVEAKSAITQQIGRLRSAQTAAPAQAAAEIQREIEVLEKTQSELKEDGLSKEGRKSLQWNLFNRRNAKTLDQTQKGSDGR